MKGIFNFLSTLYKYNKRMFIVVVLIIAAFLLIGCATGNATAPPPSPYVGGGCGG